MDQFGRMLELSRQGFFCAQIILQLGLDAEGKENQELIRAMGGLSGGLGNTGGTCGCLTGGMCLLSYFAGKGSAEEWAHAELDAMCAELSAWFAEYSAEYGGTDCRTIIAGDEKNKMQRCPLLVQAVFAKCVELLSERGIV